MELRKMSILLAIVILLCAVCGCEPAESVSVDDTNDDIGTEIMVPDSTESLMDESEETDPLENDLSETDHEEAGTPDPIIGINEADYVVENGVLTSYVGTSTVVYLPDTVNKIDADAFAASSVADSITEINLGTSVEEISPDAFENLPKLQLVNVSDANATFRQIDVFNGSNGDGSSYSGFWAWYKDGVEAVIYRKDNLALPMELNSIPNSSPDEVVTVLCDGAELKISFIKTRYTEKYAAKLHAIKYKDQVLDFDEPLPLTGNFSVYTFAFADGFVFKRSTGNDDVYILTDQAVITMPWGNARSQGVVTLSCDENGNLIYHKENATFASAGRQTSDPFSSIITGPDYYFGEEGRVEIVDGELVFVTEVTYTVEDFIHSQGLTMEEWLEERALYNPGSLEKLYQFNKENPYDYWESRRVYYDTTVDFKLWGYNGEDTVLNLPAAIKSIADHAFSSSPVADKITEINIGPNVEEISINAFAGLPSLERVNIDPENPYFISDGETITSSQGDWIISVGR